MTEKAPGPLTMDEAEKWLLRLEDIATIERDAGFATRFIFGNLLLHLHKTGIMDSRAFILSLRSCLLNLEAANERMAVELMIDELLELLPPQSPSEPGQRMDH